MKLQYSVLIKRYTEIQEENRQIRRENDKLNKYITEQKKSIERLEKGVLELNYLLSVKLEKEK